MDIFEFHRKMKQHCDRRSGNCSQCCFLDYCYSSKMDIYDDFLADVLSALSSCEESDMDSEIPPVRNRHNVLNAPMSSRHK